MAKPGRVAWAPTNEEVQVIVKRVKDGATLETIARELGIGVNTLYVYKAKHPELNEIIKNARKDVETEVTGVLMSFIRDTATPPAQRLTATIFWLKCRAGWKDGSHKELDPEEKEEKKETNGGFLVGIIPNKKEEDKPDVN